MTLAATVTDRLSGDAWLLIADVKIKTRPSGVVVLDVPDHLGDLDHRARLGRPEGQLAAIGALLQDAASQRAACKEEKEPKW